MASWSGIRKKLEQDYLAQSLRGRVSYFVTSYRESHDQEGRASILVDGKEVLQGNYYNYYLRSQMLPEDVPQTGIFSDVVDASILELGMFDGYTFYCAFQEYDNQSIENSLCSENLLVRIFAVLDRRVGKRRLIAMKEKMETEPTILHYFFWLRAEAEGLYRIY